MRANNSPSVVVAIVCLGSILACGAIGSPVPMAELGANKICECDTRDCMFDEWETWEFYKSKNPDAIAGLTAEERRAFDEHEARMRLCMTGR